MPEGSVDVPGYVHSNVRYLRPTIIANYGVAGITDIDCFTVEAIPRPADLPRGACTNIATSKVTTVSVSATASWVILTSVTIPFLDTGFGASIIGKLGQVSTTRGAPLQLGLFRDSTPLDYTNMGTTQASGCTTVFDNPWAGMSMHRLTT